MRIRHVSDAECEVSDSVVERLHDLRFCVFERDGAGPGPRPRHPDRRGADGRPEVGRSSRLRVKKAQLKPLA